MRTETHIRELMRLQGAENITDATVQEVKKALDGEYLDSLLDGREPFATKDAGKSAPGKRDGTGPAKGSFRAEVEDEEEGRRKERGEKCPAKTKKD